MRNKILIASTIVLLFGFASCNKNKQVVKDLDGGWQVVQIETPNGTVSSDELPQRLQFSKCKVKKENCSGTWTANDGSTYNFTYTVVSQGKSFIIGSNGTTASNQAFADVAAYSGRWAIENNASSNFIISSSNCDACGQGTEITLSN